MNSKYSFKKSNQAIRPSIFVLVLIMVCGVMSDAQADKAMKFFNKRLMGRDLSSQQGKGPTPVAAFHVKRNDNVVRGDSINLDKYFKHKHNFSAVALQGRKLVYERYNPDLSADTDFYAHGLSMTKTAVGLTIGHLYCRGDINSLDDPLSTYSKTLESTVYKNVTIRNLLRMASGVNGDRSNEKRYNRMLWNRADDGSNDIASILKSINKTHGEQGEISIYHQFDASAASVLVQDIAGKPTSEVFFESIYKQIEPTDSMFWLKDKNGISLGMAGLYMRTIDWAKFGQFMIQQLQKKTCLGEFLQDGITNSIKASARSYLKYGHFFWVSEHNGKPVIVLTGARGQAMVPNHFNGSVVTAISIRYKYGDKRVLHIVLEASDSLDQ